MTRPLIVFALVFSACSGGTLPCSASTCAGCCDSTGVCQLGNEDDACGAAGVACNTCTSGLQQCSAFQCVAKTGSGGGSAGSGTAGGGATAGGTGTAGGGFATAGGMAGGGTSCVAESDTQFCARRQTQCGATSGTDNCGQPRVVASCGTCTSPTSCSAGTCTCVSESNTQFCARLNRSCGAASGTDNCGRFKSVTSCGTCASGNTCTAAGTCMCNTETNAQFCARKGATCGALSGTDNCGNTRNVASCGSCSGFNTCGGSGTPNTCGCAGETNAELCMEAGSNCGALTTYDRCGATRNLNCGTCTGTNTCQLSGAANVCAADPGPWVVRHSRNQPTMHFVHAVTANDVWGANGTALYRFQGTRWNPAGTLPFTPSAFLVRAPNDVWAVGRGGTVVMARFDGTTWTNATGVPALPAGSSLRAIWARSATEMYAVGQKYSATGSGGTSLILRYDGTTWVEETITPARQDELTGVGGWGTQTWAVGRGGTMLTRVGTQWLQDQAAQTVVGGNAMMNQLWSASTGDLRAVDYSYGGIYRYNGTAWSWLTGGSSYLRKAWAPNDTDTWYVGSNGSGSGFYLRKVGSSTIFGYENFSDLHGAVANDAWAVGLTSLSQGIIYRFNGTTWRDFVDSPTNGSVKKLSGHAANDIWAVGTEPLHYDGTAWSSAGTGMMDTVFACGPNEAWALSGATAYRLRLGQATTTVAVPMAPSGTVFSGIWGASCSDLWLAGYASSGFGSGQTVLYHYENGTFTRVTLFAFPNTTSISQLWGFAANDIWAANNSGKLIHYDGTLWSQVATTTPPANGTLWGSAPNNLWDVSCESYSCSIWRYDGATWSETAFPDTENFCLAGVAGKSATDVWAVGGCRGTFGGPTTLRTLHFDGARWTEQVGSTIPDTPLAVWGSSTGYWLAGEHGLFMSHP
ncbi:MAG: hypothetical protein JNK82_12765 [Myxococcaceae bacterium]|nr:hypothetical protein [Myxococcaceae bacterium]